MADSEPRKKDSNFIGIDPGFVDTDIQEYRTYLADARMAVRNRPRTVTGAAHLGRRAPENEGTVEDRIKEEELRASRLRNDDVQQDIELKKKTLNRLFVFLGLETAVIFGFALVQGTGWWHFQLQEWSFNLLITATIAQITGMLFVAVNYLFPKK